jgi:peptidoglycan L-alanyl-D-glutamate endopeptidase CwlK
MILNRQVVNKSLGVICAVCVVASGFVFGQRSENNLKGVDTELVAVTRCALEHTPVDFVVIDGLRTAEEHAANLKKGVSWVKRSKHQDGLAIDVGAWIGVIRWDHQPYIQIAQAFNYCSLTMGVPIIWGGEWRVKDLMHIELDRKTYP